MIRSGVSETSKVPVSTRTTHLGATADSLGRFCTFPANRNWHTIYMTTPPVDATNKIVRRVNTPFLSHAPDSCLQPSRHSC